MPKDGADRFGTGRIRLGIEIEDCRALVSRGFDPGLKTFGVELPQNLTVDLRLNEPHHASQPAMVKAGKKPLAEKPADYGFVADLFTAVPDLGEWR